MATKMNQRTCRFGELELAMLTAGSGPPMVLVPGHTMSIERWVQAGYVDDLATDHHVIAIDPLGHGRSSHTADIDAYRPDLLLAHLITVLDFLEVEQAIAWGYSRGAMMAEQLARAHPDRVRALVYGGNVLFDPLPILEQLGMAPDLEALRAAHRRALDGDWSAYWQHFPVPLPDSVKSDIESRNHLPSISASGLAGALEPTPWIGTPPVPTLAYWGRNEIFHQLNVDHAAELDIDTDTVPGGHAQAFDPGAPALAVVRSFLASLD